jgi:scyllo-inositol 2-dehydrogenase (NADP+)
MPFPGLRSCWHILPMARGARTTFPSEWFFNLREHKPQRYEDPVAKGEASLIDVGLIGFGFSGRTFHAPVITGQLERIVLFESRFDRFRPQVRPRSWRQRAEPGSGLLFDLGTHLIDQALGLFGTPEAVSADLRKEREGAIVDDAFDVTLFYPGMRALLRAGMLVSESALRFVVQGTRGSYLKFGMDPQEEALKHGERPEDDNWGVESSDRWGTLHLADGEKLSVQPLPTARGDYRQYYENVRDALLGKTPLAVTPQQAVDVMRAFELAQEASRTGCKIPWRA